MTDLWKDLTGKLARCFKKQNLAVDSFEKQTYLYMFIPH